MAITKLIADSITSGAIASTPGFLVRNASDLTVSDGSFVKVNLSTVVFDTDNAYDNTTNYRFTPQVAGKYLVYGNLELSSGTSGSHSIEACYMLFYKNGSVYARFRHDPDNDEFATFCGGSIVMDFNGSTDYLEAYVYLDTSNSQTPNIEGHSTQNRSYLGAYKIIE
jgi:hypothetical protein